MSDSCTHDLADREVACNDGMCPICLAERNAKLVAALIAAVRAAKLALFVIRKQDVMPNNSWQAGFDGDLKVAEDALAALQSEGTRER